MRNSPQTSQDIMQMLKEWRSQQVDMQPIDQDAALKKLSKAKMPEEEIKDKLAQLTLNGEDAHPRVLASYPDLHALDRIDQSRNVKLDHPSARAIRAVLQAAEIGLLNSSDLSKRAVADIDAGNIGDAEEKNRWISSFQQTLHSLALLAAKIPSYGEGATVSIAHSPHAGLCLDDLEAFHKAMQSAGLTSEEHISTLNLHNPGRSITHHASIDSNYTRLWQDMLQQANLPGVSREADENEYEFYERVVGTKALNLAVNELDQKGDNFLRQFRAYHQMSEILVQQANELIADAIPQILDKEYGNLRQANENMKVALSMLDVVNQNVVPILRNLSVNKYQDIRGSLGITSGSHSPHLRGGLFGPIYTMFIAAVKHRVAGDGFTNKETLEAALEKVMDNPLNQDQETYDQYQLLQQAHKLHLAVRNWRELHGQFILTQIPTTPDQEQTTGSISGSKSALRAAHGMKYYAHSERDVALPLYESLLGKDYNAVSKTAFAPDEGSFLEELFENTAKVVAERSAPVQNRIHRR
jgi:tryptophan 2,3-dioxygenase